MIADPLFTFSLPPPPPLHRPPVHIAPVQTRHINFSSSHPPLVYYFNYRIIASQFDYYSQSS